MIQEGAFASFALYDQNRKNMTHEE